MTAREILTLCCRIAADANIHYCLNINEPPPPAWDGLTNAMQEGMIKGAQMALAGSSPEQSHENWCKTRLAEGWEYATITDRDNKKHACLVPYNELPEAQRVKDALFQGIVCAVYDALMPGDRAASRLAEAGDTGRGEKPFSRGEVRRMSPEEIQQLLQEWEVPAQPGFNEAVQGLQAAVEAMKKCVGGEAKQAGDAKLSDFFPGTLVPKPGRIYGVTLGRFSLQAGEAGPGSCSITSAAGTDRTALTVHRDGDSRPIRVGFVRLGHPRLISNREPEVQLTPGKDPSFAYWSDYKVDVIFGVQRFGSGWRVYAPSNRIICDIEAGDELVRCFGKQVEDPAPTGEPPSDLRAKLDAELQQEEGQ